MTASKPLPVTLSHQLPGRARLNVEDPDEEGVATERLLDALAGHPAVRQVRANKRARSMLVLHSGEIASVLSDVTARGIIVLRERAPAANLSLRQLKDAIVGADARIGDQTNGHASLAGVAFVAFTAAGVWQALNGHLLPTGGTLFQYALGVMQWGAEREAPTSRVTTKS